MAALTSASAAPPPAAASPVPPLVRREDEDGVVTLTLAGPNRNALSLAMLDTLILVLADIGKDERAGVVVLTGDGPAFSGGHDLKEIQAHRGDGDGGKAFNEELFARCSMLMQAVVAQPQPVIAAVEGVATAAGCQLAASCDLAVAGRNARFGLSGVVNGLFCSTPLVAVGRVMTRKHALEMGLTGALYGAEEAERFGLVNRVVAEGQALAEAKRLARTIVAHSRPTLALGKRVFYAQIEKPLEAAYRFASAAMVDNLAEPDANEGLSAFIEKRPPRWGG